MSNAHNVSGARLKSLMKKLKLSEQELALESLTSPVIEALVDDDAHKVSFITVERIAHALGLEAVAQLSSVTK